MTTTYFIDGTTPIVSSWLNDVNTGIYTTLPTLQPLLGRQRGSVTAIADQTFFTVPFTYTVGNNSMNVYINGVRQLLGSSYTETNATHITFSAAVPVTAIVEFATV